MAAGLIMLIIGLFILLRTVNKDSGGQTLVDHLQAL